LTGNSCGKGLYQVENSAASVTVTATPVANAFLYSSNFADGTVSAFRRNTSNGALSFIAKQSAGAVNGPMGIAVAALNDLVFVANAADGRVYEFGIVQTGSSPGNLTSLGSIAAGFTPQMVAIDESDNFVYVTNAGSQSVSQYTINSSGMLVANGTIVGFLGTPFGITAHPSSPFIYVSDNTAGLLYTYSIGSTGTLTQVGGAVDSNGTAPGQPSLMAIASDSNQLYLMVNDASFGVVSVFLILSDGTLLYSGSYGIGQLNPIGIGAVNNVGTSAASYVLTANMAGNFVQPYLRTGAILTQQNAITDIGGPTGLVIDPAGLFAYTGNSLNGTIGLIGINSSQCGGQIICGIQSFASESPANVNAGTQFVATTH